MHGLPLVATSDVSACRPTFSPFPRQQLGELEDAAEGYISSMVADIREDLIETRQ